jgi:integrase
LLFPLIVLKLCLQDQKSGVKAMKAQINKKLLDSLWGKTPDRPQEFYDTKDSGYMLRQQPSGRIAFYVRYRGPIDGRQTRALIATYDRSDDGKTQTSLIEVRKKAKDVLHRIQTEKLDPIAVRQAERKAAQIEVTLADFLTDTYLPEVALAQRSGKGTVARLRKSFATLLSLRLRDLNDDRILDWRGKRLTAVRADDEPKSRGQVTLGTINKEVRLLKTALNYAIQRKLLVEMPFHNVKNLKAVDVNRVRYLSAEEEANLRASLDKREADRRKARTSANDYRATYSKPLFPSLNAIFTDSLKPRVLISMNTGVRRGELLTLKWRNIDWEQKLITVEAHNAKGMITRRINLNSEVMEILAAWRDQLLQPMDDDQRKYALVDAYVFPGKKPGKPMTEVKTAWHNLLTDAKIVDFHWHDLRHHFASRLVMEGVDLNRVRDLMGHKTIAMTLRYAHLAPEHTAEAVERITRSAPVVEQRPKPTKVVQFNSTSKRKRAA